MKKSMLGIVYNHIMRYSGERKVIILGGDHNLDSKLALNGLDFTYFIEREDITVQESDIQNIEKMLNALGDRIEQYYYIIPLAYHEKLKLLLSQYGLINHKDYVYVANEEIKISITDTDYKDEYGNCVIVGQDIKLTKPLNVTFKGVNAKVIIGNEVAIGENVHIICDNNAQVIVENNVSIKSNSSWLVWENARLTVERDCILGSQGIIECSGNTKVYIGEDTRIGAYHKIVAHVNTEIHIGAECDISTYLEMRTNDGHTIFDIHTAENINSNREANKNIKLNIGNHVWIGNSSMFVGNVDVGQGSIVGARSFVKKQYPNNCVIAGVPAKVVKTDIAWSRENYAEDMSSIKEEYIAHTHKE